MKRASSGNFDPVPLLLHWFASHRRNLPWRKNRSLYRVWVAEVMLQQTRVETAVPYFRDFLKRFPSLSQLADASLQDVLKAWEGLGYYSRARNLWRAARTVRKDFHGLIPVNYDEFRKFPGVGDYIAAAVLSISCDQALAAVDGNVLRVVCRWQGISEDIRLPAAKRSVRSFLETVIPEAAPGVFNEALMELGALVCLPKNPLCRQCPLLHGCFAFGHGKSALLPVKSRKKPVPTHQVALAVIVRAGKMFIQQRPETGHLGGLWEFPGGKCRVVEEPQRAVVRECREELGIEVEVLTKFAEVRHSYSHFRIILHVFACRLSKGRPKTIQPHAWVKSDKLPDFPFPAANHKFFPLLKEHQRLWD